MFVKQMKEQHEEDQGYTQEIVRKNKESDVENNR